MCIYLKNLLALQLSGGRRHAGRSIARIAGGGRAFRVLPRRFRNYKLHVSIEPIRTYPAIL